MKEVGDSAVSFSGFDDLFLVIVEIYFICGKSKQELSWYKKRVRFNRHDLYSL
jgi:hypothetical protein